jgi:hypothetical protein
MIPAMRDGDAGRVQPFIAREDGGDDRRYLSMLFSDLGDFPPGARPLREQLEGKVETAEAGANGSLTVKPQAVRPFIEEVLNVPAAPEPGRGSTSRWKVAALSVVGFLAVGGIGVAMISVGYQASARDRQIVPARAAALPQVAQDSGSTDAAGVNLSGFQGCTKGEGLSPLGLMLVARDFVSTTTEPAVCLPTETPRKKDGPKRPADQTTSTPTIVGTTPSGSSGGTVPGSGSGGAPGTGTGGGGSGEPAPTPTPTDPPDGGGTIEPDKPGNGWGKGGKPKGSATG